MIEVEGLSKTFRVHKKEPGLKGSLRSLFKRQWLDKHALKSVSLKVSPGEIVGLIGENGAGKTTLVKALTGIIHPSSGSARVLGHIPWKRDDEFRSQIALIMGQKAQLWWDLPAADCFLLLQEIYQIPAERFQKTLSELTEALKVKDQLNIQIRRLSLGERMKMELIAALLHEPKVVFLDEPTIGLDLMAQRAVREFLLKYRRTHNPAMIVTSHYMEDIERLCKRIIILREGEIVYDGPLEQIVREYARDKIITVQLVEGSSPQAKEGFLSAQLADLFSSEGPVLKFRVPRARVPEAASAIMKAYEVADLNIEDPQIGVIIESILRKRAHQ